MNKDVHVSREIINPYRYKCPHICRALKISRMTLWNWERLGRITLPRNLHGDRIVTEEQLREIVKAFSPGKKRQWHFVPEE